MKDPGWWLALGARVAELIQAALELQGEGYSQKREQSSLATGGVWQRYLPPLQGWGSPLGDACLHSLCCSWWKGSAATLLPAQHGKGQGCPAPSWSPTVHLSVWAGHDGWA